MQAYWAVLTGLSAQGRTRHYEGMPPDQRLLPVPSIVLIEHRPDGWFIFRLTAAGEDAGDTWHESLADAKHQLEFEYGDSTGVLQEVPTETEDMRAYVLSRLKAPE